jgi:uncharacterized protein (TIGR03085 family)
VRAHPNLNEFFVHHEDVRRAHGLGPRPLSPGLDAALWRNACQGSCYLARRLGGTGLELEWVGLGRRHRVRGGQVTARVGGAPGELLLYLFGRQSAARVELSGPAEALAALGGTHLGM